MSRTREGPREPLVVADGLSGTLGHQDRTRPGRAGDASVQDRAVTITGCTVTYMPGGKTAGCRDSGRGWVADVALPDNAPPGSGTLAWKVAYTRGGENGSTDGNVTIPVLQQEQSLLDKLWAVGWRTGLGALGLAALIGVRAGGRSWRRWREEHHREQLPAGVSVALIRPYGPPSATTDEPDAPPRRVIRLTLHRGTPRVRLREEARR